MLKRKDISGPVRTAIEGAEIPTTATARREPDLPAGLGARFEARKDGLYRKGSDGNFFRFSDPIWLLAATRDAQQTNWGYLIGWYDDDEVWHSEIFERGLFAGDCSEVRTRLQAGGVRIAPMLHQRQALVEFLNCARVEKRARSVVSPGWHQFDGVPVFVGQDRVIGEAVEPVIYSGARLDINPFGSSGTLAGWQKLSGLCGGNSRLLFSVSCAFAASLFGIIGEPSGGFNLRGKSRTGKTTLLGACASVAGGTRDRGADGYYLQWRSTDNGLEVFAGIYSDSVLCIDETGQANASRFGSDVYMLMNMAGKARASRNAGSIKPTIKFRNLILSTGEKGLDDLNKEAGRATKAGEETRFTDIPSDAGAGLGVFEYLHDANDVVSFANELAQLRKEQYGTAGPAFIAKLVEIWRGDADYPDILRNRAGGIVRDLLKNSEEAGGQVRSVAMRFALVQLAGTLAEEFGIVSWRPGDACIGVARCFRDWLRERGGLGAREDDHAITQLRDFILSHGASRFAIWPEERRPEEPPGCQTPYEPGLKAELFRPLNSAGWRKLDVRVTESTEKKPFWTYYLTAPGMHEVLTGLLFRDALRTLVQRGFIIPDAAGRSSRAFNLPGLGPIRLYKVSSSILEAQEGGMDE